MRGRRRRRRHNSSENERRSFTPAFSLPAPSARPRPPAPAAASTASEVVSQNLNLTLHSAGRAGGRTDGRTEASSGVKCDGWERRGAEEKDSGISEGEKLGMDEHSNQRVPFFRPSFHSAIGTIHFHIRASVRVGDEWRA